MDTLLVCVVALLPLSVLSSHSEPGILFKNSNGNRAVFVPLLPTNPCRIYGSRYYIQRLGTTTQTIDISDAALNGQIATCQLRNSLRLNAPNQPQRDRMEFIYPGTKWCGPGDIADNPDDLGIYRNTDQCCREHDHCQMFIRTNECNHGLCNNSPFTRSHCSCDERFRQCLMANNDKVSDSVGVAFFNVGGVVCFQEDFRTMVTRASSCTNRMGKRKKRCAPPQSHTYQFVQPEKYKSPSKVSARSLLPETMSSPIDRVRSFVSDVGTVVRTVAESHMHMFHLNRAGIT